MSSGPGAATPGAHGRGPVPLQLLPDHSSVAADGTLSIGGCRIDDTCTTKDEP